MHRLFRAALLAALATAPLVAHADKPAPKTAKTNRKDSQNKKSKEIPKPPLEGNTIDFNYDAKETGHPERAYMGRAFVHKKAAQYQHTELPLIVFIHGLNREKIKYRWMGGGNEGDVRRIISEMIESSSISPVLLAAPSSIIPAAVDNAVLSWPAFDLDRFVELTEQALTGSARIDKKRVIVVGHSGGGCNTKGGIYSTIQSKTKPMAVFSVDTCMLPDSAIALSKAPPDMHIIVSYQTQSWAGRPISEFQKHFEKEIKKLPPNPNVLRHLEQIRPKEPMPHDAMVPITLRTWLPKLLADAQPPPKAAPAVPCTDERL